MANEKRLIWDADMKTAFREWFDHEDFRTMNQVIDDIPTVDAVEVVHGRWVGSGQWNHKPYRMRNKEKWQTYFCSECGHSNGRRFNDNYCPNCGAKMDGDGND